jgi:hypothetical protein
MHQEMKYIHVYYYRLNNLTEITKNFLYTNTNNWHIINPDLLM